MECTGRLKGVAKDWVTGKWIITFEMDGDITAGLDQMRDKLLTIVTKVYRKKRSLDANGMYWKLLGELAEALKVSKPYLHNQMLRRYGQLEMIDGQCVPLKRQSTISAQHRRRLKLNGMASVTGYISSSVAHMTMTPKSSLNF